MTSGRPVVPVVGLAVARRVERAAVIAIVIAFALVALSSPAWALCPNCLGQTRSLTPTLELLGAFLLVPFVIAYVVSRVIRRACRR
jgi:uncharacterized membrane protein